MRSRAESTGGCVKLKSESSARDALPGYEGFAGQSWSRSQDGFIVCMLRLQSCLSAVPLTARFIQLHFLIPLRTYLSAPLCLCLPVFCTTAGHRLVSRPSVSVSLSLSAPLSASFCLSALLCLSFSLPTPRPPPPSPATTPSPSQRHDQCQGRVRSKKRSTRQTQ